VLELLTAAGVAELIHEAIKKSTGIAGDGALSRGIEYVQNEVRDRLAGMRDAPEGLTVRRAVRTAQIQAVERVIRDYDESFWRPKWLGRTRSNRFIEASLRFCASAAGRTLSLARTSDPGGALSLIPVASWSLTAPFHADVPTTGGDALISEAEEAVLDELRKAVHPHAIPRTFVEHFRYGRRGYKRFWDLFGRYMQQQLTTNDSFFRAYSTSLLARVAELATEANASTGRTEVGIEALREDYRVGVADASAHLGAGESLNFAPTDAYFGRRLTPAATFNHARPLAGREELLAQLSSAVSDSLQQLGVGVVSFTAIGGCGKSRLLLELARRFESKVPVRWVREEGDVGLGAMSQLPPGPLLLICDDAHRRSDLPGILRMADARSGHTVVLVSMRPYGKDALYSAMFSANVAFDQLRDYGELSNVPETEFLPAVEDELGSEYQHLARQVLRLVGGSALIALVAARLLRTRQLDPQVIVLDQEFRATVLEGFRQEAIGTLPGMLSDHAARRLLETLAAVQPITLTDDELEDRLAQYLGIEVSELRRLIAALIDGGVVRSGQSGLRIVPDVLGDHILNTAMVVHNSPTALDAEILNGLGDPVLANLVRNLAELDWQRALAEQRASVFTGVWTSFTEMFFAAPNWQRAQWIRQLGPVAAFQPLAILQLVKRLVATTPSDDRPSGDFGVGVLGTQVVRLLPPLLATVAHHRDHTDEALDLLWDISREDDRDTNPYPEHGIRQLAEVVSYSRRRHLWLQEHALNALERWIVVPGWSAARHSPLFVVKAVLATEVLEHEFDEREMRVTMTRVGLHAGNTRALRLRAVAILERIAGDSDVGGRHQALAQLHNALRRPFGSLGHAVSADEEESFREQYTAVFDAIERLIQRGTDALGLVSIRSELNSAAQFTLLTWKAERLRKIAASIQESRATRLVIALSYGMRDWYPDRATYEERERQLAAMRRLAVEELVQAGETADGVARTLAAECDVHEAAKAHYQPGHVLWHLVQQHPDIAVGVGRWVIAGADSGDSRYAKWLPPLLAALRVAKPTEYQALLRQAAASHWPDLRWAAAAALTRVQGDRRRTPSEFELLRALLADQDLVVVRSALASLPYLDIDQTESLLPEVSLHGDESAAERLADAWAMAENDQHPMVDAATAARLLGELTEVPDLSRDWHVARMLAVVAQHHPQAIVDFLCERVRRERTSWAELRADELLSRYDAIPLHGFPGVSEALRATAEYDAILERLLSPLWTTEAGDTERKAVALEVLRTLGGWDAELDRIVRRWIAAGDCERLRFSATLFGQLPRTFIVTDHTLVGALLSAMDRCPPGSRSLIEQALERAAFGNDFVVRTVGEPHPVTASIAEKSDALAAQFEENGHHVAASFYLRIAQRAREEIATDQRRDDETRRMK
jgi:hypothetical protein